jgi:hypothetical protein
MHKKPLICSVMEFKYLTLNNCRMLQLKKIVEAFADEQTSTYVFGLVTIPHIPIDWQNWKCPQVDF